MHVLRIIETTAWVLGIRRDVSAVLRSARGVGETITTTSGSDAGSYCAGQRCAQEGCDSGGSEK